MKKLGLSTRVFIGFGLGILLGVIFGEKVLVIKIIGDIFLKLIKMLTVPLVFFSIISGITNLTDVNKLKRVGVKILGMYVVTTLLAGFRPWHCTPDQSRHRFPDRFFRDRLL